MTTNRIGIDADLFEAFYREHVESVQRYLARRVVDPYLAADLTADVFVAAIQSAPRYDPGRGSPRAWLFGIAKNVLANDARRAARESTALARDHGARVLEPDALDRALDRIDAEREARALLGRIDALPEGLRSIIELVAVDGLTVSDAATVLGITPVAARVRLHRARNHLAVPPFRVPVHVREC